MEEREQRHHGTVGPVLTSVANNLTLSSTAFSTLGTPTPLIVAMRTRGPNQDPSNYLASIKVQANQK